ncbi:MAG: hypothetical protein IKZ58_00820 [Selenomonadaceae bacterium]|nr:hypothetical protein [Selenomonadaceae bacterium]
MSLNINKNFGAISNNALASLNKHQSVMGKAITRVSTGMRVNSAVDDASAYMASKKIQADSTGYTALSNGIQTASAKLNAADSSASSVLDILNAMKAKAIEYQAASGDGDAQGIINTEFQNLTKVLNSALSVKYNGEDLMSSTSVNAYTSIYSGTYTSASSIKNGKISTSWDIASATNAALTATEIGADGKIQNGASDTIVDKLTEAITNVVAEQGKIGAALEAMDYSASFLANAANAQETAFTSITEADMAKEMTTYVKNNVLAQASQAMIAQANQSMAQVLNLLQ